MFFVGIDIGSSATKAVAIDSKKNILGVSISNLGTGTIGVENTWRNLHDDNELSPVDCALTVATGYGRKKFAAADFQVSELSCHAKGVNSVLPNVKTIIDIGGQDCKAIRIDSKGTLQQFVMNDKCAAGTGRFLETMCRVLSVDLSKLGEIDLSATGILTISNTCTVFAESEVISKLSEGEKIENIIAGIHQSVCKRVAGLTFRVGITPDVCLTGGVAQNSGIVRAMKKELKCDISVPPMPQITGALGAAILALDKYETGEK